MTEVVPEDGLGAAQPEQEQPVTFLAVDAEGRGQRYTLPRSLAVGMARELHEGGARIAWHLETPRSDGEKLEKRAATGYR
jgi:hypothetical protein